MNTYCVLYLPEGSPAQTALAHFFALSAQDAVDLFRLNHSGRIVGVFCLDLRGDWR